jgi:hypothetical protein
MEIGPSEGGSMTTKTRRPRPQYGVLTAAALLAALMAAFLLLGYASPDVTAAQAQYAPTNTAPPTVSDTTPQAEQTITATEGTWTGDAPQTTTFKWERCNAGGTNCVAIPAAIQQSYTVQAADVGNTLRVRVTRSNSNGSTTVNSAVTSPVTAAPAAGTTIPVTAVNPPDRLLIDQVQFSPNPIRSRFSAFTVRVRVLDTRGRNVSGALVFLRSTPVVTTTPPERTTDANGFVTFTVQPERDFGIVYRRGYNLQFLVRARKPGDNPLAGVSTRRLVQVGIRPAA